MTVGDFLKRIDPENDKDKMLILFDGEGWSNIMLYAESNSEIVIRADCSSPFSDEG